jgi:predicted anti-sigma-YlaC factor YlaD
MMTCKEVLESLSSLLDAEMQKEVVAEMHRHIGNCTHCRAELDTLHMTIKLYKHEPTAELPHGCHDRLVKVLELEKMKKGPAAS